MKWLILFVDDEPNILKGLQRSLRPLRKQWEMVFVDSGATALECLDKNSFDVIVSDMRMPQPEYMIIVSGQVPLPKRLLSLKIWIRKNLTMP